MWSTCRVIRLSQPILRDSETAVVDLSDLSSGNYIIRLASVTSSSVAEIVVIVK